MSRSDNNNNNDISEKSCNGTIVERLKHLNRNTLLITHFTYRKVKELIEKCKSGSTDSSIYTAIEIDEDEWGYYDDNAVTYAQRFWEFLATEVIPLFGTNLELLTLKLRLANVHVNADSDVNKNQAIFFSALQGNLNSLKALRVIGDGFGSAEYRGNGILKQILRDTNLPKLQSLEIGRDALNGLMLRFTIDKLWVETLTEIRVCADHIKIKKDVMFPSVSVLTLEMFGTLESLTNSFPELLRTMFPNTKRLYFANRFSSNVADLSSFVKKFAGEDLLDILGIDQTIRSAFITTEDKLSCAKAFYMDVGCYDGAQLDILNHLDYEVIRKVVCYNCKKARLRKSTLASRAAATVPEHVDVALYNEFEE